MALDTIARSLAGLAGQAQASQATKDRPPPSSDTEPGGRFIQGATVDEGGVRRGGRVVNADGKMLAEFGPDQENTG